MCAPVTLSIYYTLLDGYISHKLEPTHGLATHAWELSHALVTGHQKEPECDYWTHRQLSRERVT